MTSIKNKMELKGVLVLDIGRLVNPNILTKLHAVKQQLQVGRLFDNYTDIIQRKFNIRKGLP